MPLLVGGETGEVMNRMPQSFGNPLALMLCGFTLSLLISTTKGFLESGARNVSSAMRRLGGYRRFASCTGSISPDMIKIDFVVLLSPQHG
jgi:hypothetical protein